MSKRRMIVTSQKLTDQTSVSKQMVVEDDDMIDCCDDIIGDCLIFEEQDQALAKQLVSQNYKSTIERIQKSYMTSGKDLGVLVELFQLSGSVDAVLIEHGELKPIQIVQKV